ncbi:carbohydrate ABC transporter permease [Amycolatopsis sp. DG1A-15b]|jgi:multiple sugar transport system permease protein|uniref:carbohydrate ABC transporter permease n=1 Tax=Amycolatopsis sp. DG1A-15b TaxID=3052846 RepID=UPI00255BD3A7|nr:carbohydrate ABC transporter permease [Amycolatopsis sp. DG1A-15b]WIX89100.1 carbohydrate ABC transporter permease [Amycolatopsis sp. DG1A-15b]
MAVNVKAPAKTHWRAHGVLLAAVVVMIYPLVWLVGASFKPENQIFSTLDPIPWHFTFDNYLGGWTATGTSFTVYLTNSATIALCVVIGNIASCSLAAYAFARLDFAFRKIWFGLMLGTLMLPFQATMIPQYTIFYKLNWINTFLPLVVPQLLACDAFFIFLMVQFIRGIPRELDEAAAIDGAGHARVFFSVILPLLRPALLTTGVLTFIWTFNDFLRQLVYLSDKSRYTVPLGLNSFIDRASGSSYGGMLAMSVVTLVPTVAVFLICQKRLVDGVANSGIKG